MRPLRLLATAAVVSFTTVAAAFACGGDLGADQPVIDRIQAPWGAGEELMQAALYPEALAKLRSTVYLLPRIQNATIRECVAGGASSRIAAVTAGQAYLARHTGDIAGAKAAADLANRNYPSRHDCP